MPTDLHDAKQIFNEAKRVQKAFKECGSHWSIEMCIDSLKDKYPFNTFSSNSFNMAALLEQNNP